MSLDINIVSARTHEVYSANSKPQLYVVVSVATAANEQKARTHVDKDGGGNPTWNFVVKFAVDVDGLKRDCKTRLVFALKCEDGRGERDLGDVHVSVAELLQSAGGRGNSLRYVAVSYPVRNPFGQTVGVLNFEYKFGGSPASDTPASGLATRNIDVYPPQGYHYPPPPPAAGFGLCPLQPSGPYPPPSLSPYTPPSPYPPYNAGSSAAPPYNLGPSATPPPYPPYNLGPSAAPPPYPPYNVGPQAAPPYANPYPQHPSHVHHARAQPPMVQRSTPKKKKSVWGSALGVAGAVAVGVLSGVVGSSLELPSAPELPLDLPAVPEMPQLPVDPTAFAPTDLAFTNTFDPQAFRDATYVDYSSLAPG